MTSFSQVARTLGLSQSALSTAIKKLEEDFQAKLFERSLDGIKLTPTGTLVMELLQKSYSNLANELGTVLGQEIKVPVRIGCVPHFGAKFLLPYLKANRDVPQPIHLYNVWSVDGHGAVKTGHLDFAFISWTTVPKDLPYIEIKKDPVAIVGSKKYFPQLAKATTFEEVAVFPLVKLQKPQYPWKGSLTAGKTEFLVRDTNSARHLILEGHGVGELQVDTFSDQELKSLCQAKAPVAHPNVRIYVVYTAQMPASSRLVMNQMIESLRKL